MRSAKTKSPYGCSASRDRFLHWMMECRLHRKTGITHFHFSLLPNRTSPNYEYRSLKEQQCCPTIAMLFLLGLSLTMPLSDALAQSSTGRGAVSGAIIGGAVGGRRGAAIGAATGAVAGSRHQRHWRGHYYWRHGQCWVRTSNGRSHPVSHRYCR